MIPTKLIKLFWSKVNKSDPEGCWDWKASKFPSGYGAFGASHNHGYSQRAHRFAWELFFEPIPPGWLVLHKCDNRGCVNPNHLFLGNTQQNTLDRDYKGRGNAPKGSNNGLSKLTETQVEHIRKDQRSTHAIGKDYGVSHMTISRIKRRKTWGHL